MPVISFSINGTEERIEVRDDVPLLWILRDRLGLMGTKYGCGVGVCGSCTIHVDGRAVRSCITPAASLEGKRILTIEGLAGSAGGLHPLQQAWLDEDVSQCGFCQPGQLMTAAALLAGNQAPSDDDIDEAMGDVVCRCGTYLRIRKAIHRAAGNGASS